MKKTIGIACATVLFAALIAAGYSGATKREKVTESWAMDTIVRMKIAGRDSSECMEAVESLINDLDVNVLSRHEQGSVVNKLNARGGGVIDKKILPYVETMLDVASESNGAFDFTMGGVSDLWGFGNNPKVPDTEELKKAVSGCGVDHFTLNNGRAEFDGVLDFGATGKGIALDFIREDCLNGKKIDSAVISIGGSVLLYGDKTFRVGIADPNGNSGKYIAVLNLCDTDISTSGNYERFFEQDGKRYHHILDPETGYPVENGLVSVTVVSDSGILTDALSTACFVMGPENGKKLAEEYGCEAVFVTEDKKIHITDGLKDVVEITDSNYVLE